MRLQYYLDGSLLTDEPAGWQEATSVIQRVDEIKGLFVTLDVTLTFYGDAFTTLIASYGAGFCNTHTIEIKESRDDGITYVTLYEGILFISDCVFDYNNCTVECKLQDNSFYAKINNNKSIKTFVEVGRSKNDVAYTGADDYQIDIYDPCTLAIYARSPHTVRVYEAFRSLVAFMTDDTVDFESVIFDFGGEWEGYCITDGLHISSLDIASYSSTTNITKFSFIDLFQEIDKKFNIGMMIDTSGARPKVVIENQDHFRNTTSVVPMTKINGMKASVDVDSLYSQLHLGSAAIAGTGCGVGGLAFPLESTFITFNDETFYVLGTCNIDKTLDLYSQWIIDTNIIQDCVVNGSADYDQQIVLLETVVVGPFSGTTVRGNPFNDTAATPRFYNPGLMNNSVTVRYLGAVPNSIASTLDDLTADCYIYRSQTNLLIFGLGASTQSYSPVQFNDKTTPPYYDTGGNFTLVTGRYTAATGGLFNFRSVYNIIMDYVDVEVASLLYIRAIYRHYDSFGVQIGSDNIIENSFDAQNIPPPLINQTYTADSQIFNMAVADYVNVTIQVQWNLTGIIGSGGGNQVIFQIKSGTFETLYTSVGGGVVQSYDPDEYPAFKYEFEYPLTAQQFDTLIAQPNYAVTLDVDGINTFNAFIKEAKYKRKTGMAQFTCIASKSMT